MRIRQTLPVLILATACTNGDPISEAGATWAGLWLLVWGEAGAPEGTNTCDENFNDASCAEEEEVEDTGPDIVYENDEEASPPSTIIEVITDDAGNVHFLLDGKVITGPDGGPDGVTALWSGFTNRDQSTSFESEYAYTLVQKFDSKVTLTINVDAETGAASGSIEQTLKTEVKATESDEIDEETPIQVGAINQFTGALESDDEEEPDLRFNYGDRDDCSGSDCEITLTNTVKVSRPFTGTHLEDNGFPSSGQYPDIGNPEGGDDDLLSIFHSNSR